jgi:hypothetical protein
MKETIYAIAAFAVLLITFAVMCVAALVIAPFALVGAQLRGLNLSPM